MSSFVPKKGHVIPERANLLCGAVVPSSAGGTNWSPSDRPNGNKMSDPEPEPDPEPDPTPEPEPDR